MKNIITYITEKLHLSKDTKRSTIIEDIIEDLVDAIDKSLSKDDKCKKLSYNIDYSAKDKYIIVKVLNNEIIGTKLTDTLYNISDIIKDTIEPELINKFDDIKYISGNPDRKSVEIYFN